MKVSKEGLEIRVVSLKGAEAAYSDDCFVDVAVFVGAMEVPDRCIGSMNDILHCLSRSDWEKWEGVRDGIRKL